MTINLIVQDTWKSFHHGPHSSAVAKSGRGDAGRQRKSSLRFRKPYGAGLTIWPPLRGCEKCAILELLDGKQIRNQYEDRPDQRYEQASCDALCLPLTLRRSWTTTCRTAILSGSSILVAKEVFLLPVDTRSMSGRARTAPMSEVPSVPFRGGIRNDA